MTQGFYERVGVSPVADPDDIRLAYGRAVAHLLRRREATLAQGGDTAQLDLSRAQLDEAWEVLADPVRRRRYDAMLAVARDGVAEADVDNLWARVAGAMVHPSLAAAARLVDAATRLGVGPLAAPPRPELRVAGAPAEEVQVAERRLPTDFGAPRRIGASAPPPPSTPGVVVQLPPQPREERPDLRVVESHPAAAQVVELRARVPVAAQEPPTSSSEFDGLLGRLGPSGALLKAVREERGLTLNDLAETTRISVRYLAAVEEEDFDALPSTAAFVRGYVREVARQLELDVERVVEGYMRRYRGEA